MAGPAEKQGIEGACLSVPIVGWIRGALEEGDALFTGNGLGFCFLPLKR